MSNDNVYKFQELVRTVDATLATINPKGLIDGKNTLKLIQFLSTFEGMSEFLPEEYVDYIKYKASTVESKDNVRGEVKNILMYPELTYKPWANVEFDTQTIDVSQIKFKIELVDGKVYASCISDPCLSKTMFDAFHSSTCQSPEHKNSMLKPNSEHCHITLVNSNVVYDIGSDKVKKLIDSKFTHEFNVQIGHIKSTFSRDWSVFGNCYVVEVSSPELTQFIEEFKVFKVIKPTTHVTFASVHRNLFDTMTTTN